ncbi:MAG: hypothetical protein M1511_09540 [Deltaproteobacteria bacterium]|nr:hypothetical protein [Deltaproteobacteria bacterium]
MSFQTYPQFDSWDWETSIKEIASINDWISDFPEVQEIVISPDGERVAAIVMTEDDAFTVCVNGEPWTNTFEKLWSLKFSPMSRLLSIGMTDDEWTIVEEDEPWQETFDYVWNMKFGAQGDGVAANVRTSDGYGVALNGNPWDKKFMQMRSLEVSPDGSRSAGNVQLASLAEGDIFGFKKGLWGLAVDGNLWGSSFLNVWDCVFSTDGTKVGAEVRLPSRRQTIAVDGEPWPQDFKAVWRPIFVPGTYDIVAPCLTTGGWQILINGKPVWNKNLFGTNRLIRYGIRFSALSAPSLPPLFLRNSADGPLGSMAMSGEILSAKSSWPLSSVLMHRE